MGTGLIYRARLREPEALAELMQFTRTWAEQRGWLTADAEPADLVAATVRGPDGSPHPPRNLRLAGVWLNSHFGADDLCLVFDYHTGALVDPARPGGECHDFAVTRTSYADADTHIALVSFLELLAERNLASIELGDLAGGPALRDPAELRSRMRAAREHDFRAAQANPREAPRLGGVAQFLSPDDTRARNRTPPGPVAWLEPRESAALLEARVRLLETWADATPGLAGKPQEAIPALERLTDLVLSHPAYRRDQQYLEDRFAWDAGALLGFALIELHGGHWERTHDPSGTLVRVANLGATGLTWAPLRSSILRIKQGSLYAHDRIATWLAEMVTAATAAASN